MGSEALMVFALAIILVFLVLAAQYESWAIPAAVVVVVEFAVLGTATALLMGVSTTTPIPRSALFC